MNDQDKTKEELIIGLKELQQEYNSLKASYEKEITYRKGAEEDILRHSREFATLLRISQEFATTLDLAKILQMTTDRVTELNELKSSAIYLLEGETLHLWATTPPLPPQFPDELRNAPLADHPHIHKVITTGLPVFLFDTAKANFTAAERAVCELRPAQKSYKSFPRQKSTYSTHLPILLPWESEMPVCMNPKRAMPTNWKIVLSNSNRLKKHE